MISANLQLLTPGNSFTTDAELGDLKVLTGGSHGPATEIADEGPDFGSLVATALPHEKTRPLEKGKTVDPTGAGEASTEELPGTELPLRGKPVPHSEAPGPVPAPPSHNHAVLGRPHSDVKNGESAPALADRSDTKLRPDGWYDPRLAGGASKSDAPPPLAPKGKEHTHASDATQSGDGSAKSDQEGEKPARLAASDRPIPAELRQILTETSPIVGAPEPPKHMRADAPVPVPTRTLPVVGMTKQDQRATQLKTESQPTQIADKSEPRLVGQTQDTVMKASSLTGLTATPPSASEAGPALPNASPQPANSIATNALTTASPVTPTTEIRSEARVVPQIEQAIDALTDAREAGRVSRPEVLLRHSEFGLVSMRLEAASGDLRATLASRDPGFIPAVQAALGERAVTASSETAANHNQQRGQEQGSGTFAGSGGGFSANYGSSPGSSQGSSQPRLPQQEVTQQDADFGDGHEAGHGPETGTNVGGLFA